MAGNCSEDQADRFGMSLLSDSVLPQLLSDPVSPGHPRCSSLRQARRPTPTTPPRACPPSHTHNRIPIPRGDERR
jgi:hypothetical protein